MKPQLATIQNWDMKIAQNSGMDLKTVRCLSVSFENNGAQRDLPKCPGKISNAPSSEEAVQGMPRNMSLMWIET